MERNEQLELAHRYVSQTDRHVFLTGKAGTGKTTFLHRVRREVSKRTIVVAPTGVAAINAKGVTIHSQFQLPFGVLTPDRIEADLRTHRLSRQKADVLRSLDLLIIDEISMVRADVLDAIGAVLRKYRRTDKPFGGVQLLMIGDLHQLPPVVRDNDWNQLREHYRTAYFFGSRELVDAGVRTIQLTHIYRQSDADFIHLLNQVRNDRLDATSLRQLNSRYRGPEFQPPAEEDYITLTSHNRTANQINDRQLSTLTTPLHAFRAVISGTFPESMYPNDAELSFRVGAQVMFNKNDTVEQLYYNGKIGRITAIDGKEITVRCPGEEPIVVTPVAWENRKYELNKATKEVTDEVIGTYEQHPLRLAWAITIHKSQGLTFERVIIDAAAAFAHGQVYVALSRCKTFKGIVLRSRIGDESVKTDTVVSDYSTRAEAEAPTATDLRQDQRQFQLNCLLELFDFAGFDRQLAYLERVLFEHETAIQGEALTEVRSLRSELHKGVLKPARGFIRQLATYARAIELPTENVDLTDRLKKASAYFRPHLESAYAQLGALPFMSDNRKVYDTVTERLKDVALTGLTKLRTLGSLEKGFTPDCYLRARADAQIEFEQKGKANAKQPKQAPVTTTSHPVLYQELHKWRQQEATEQGVAPYRILHNSVLLGLAEALPGDERALLAVRGFGKKSVASYGDDLLELIEDYCDIEGVEPNPGRKPPNLLPTPPPPPPPAPSSTRQVTLAAFRRGLTIPDIAKERGFTKGTIHTHLAYWVAQGELTVEDIVNPARLEAITDYLATHEITGFKQVYDHFDQTYTYGEIRLAAATLPSSAPRPTA